MEDHSLGKSADLQYGQSEISLPFLSHDDDSIPIKCPDDGRVVGRLSVNIYNDVEATRGRFFSLLEEMPGSFNYPLGVLEKIEVNVAERESGFGRFGLTLADAHLKRLGAKMALLMVGRWGSLDDWEAEKARKIRYFGKAGWVLVSLRRPSPVWMIKRYEGD